MLRKLLILMCLISTTGAIAQNKDKTTQKAADAKIDYKQMGAPLPSFVILPFHDTLAKKSKAVAPKNDSAMTAKEKRLAKKKEKKEKENKAEWKKLLTDKDVDNGANLFLMIFNPTCSHCTDQTQLFEKYISEFKKSKLVLVANPHQKPYLQDFVIHYKTDDFYPTMNVGMDSSGFMNDIYLYQAIPQINIYNHDRKLIRTFTGNTPIDSLRKYIE